MPLNNHYYSSEIKINFFLLSLISFQLLLNWFHNQHASRILFYPYSIAFVHFHFLLFLISRKCTWTKIKRVWGWWVKLNGIPWKILNYVYLLGKFVYGREFLGRMKRVHRRKLLNFLTLSAACRFNGHANSNEDFNFLIFSVSITLKG